MAYRLWNEDDYLKADENSDYALYLGDFMEVDTSYEPKRPSDWVMPKYFMGSDYSGSSVTVSNCRCFLSDFPPESNPGIRRVYGDYGTYGVAIRRDSITPEIQEVFDRLSDYIVMDEDDMSEVEREAEDEAWDSWVKSDLASALYQRGIEIDMDDDRLFDLLREAMDRENLYWENEEGNKAYVDIERIADSIARNSHFPPDPDVLVRVNNGLEVLNDYFGSPKVWQPRIDLENFDMTDAYKCTLGQVFSNFPIPSYYNGFDWGIRALGLRHHYEDCGFGGGLELTRAWTFVLSEMGE